MGPSGFPRFAGAFAPSDGTGKIRRNCDAWKNCPSINALLNESGDIYASPKQKPGRWRITRHNTRRTRCTLKLFVAVYEELSIAKASDRRAHHPLGVEAAASPDLEGSIRHLPCSTGLSIRPAADAGGGALDPLTRALIMRRSVADGQHGSSLSPSAIRAGCGSRRRRDRGRFARGPVRGSLARHDRIHIDLHEDVEPRHHQGRRGDAADIGIVAAEVPAPGLHLVPDRTHRLVVVLAAGHPLPVQPCLVVSDLASHRYHPHTGNKDTAIERLISRFFTEAGALLAPRISVSGFEAICRMAETRLGIGVVPEMTARRYMLNMKIAAVPLTSRGRGRTLKYRFWIFGDAARRRPSADRPFEGVLRFAHGACDHVFRARDDLELGSRSRPLSSALMMLKIETMTNCMTIRDNPTHFGDNARHEGQMFAGVGAEHMTSRGILV